ncbi:hypothetical protein L249_6067 [Ophiocordyceps polyrhachis-furcata BCC 54312]|uniref:TRAM domain-containing protein n=1 Tax=Ophiocordyceps polyrhachis-furcata BCC 54312 TaxID=1330021 RepID=A0A367LIU8_9HYPO|nr:hypothetical protein L249_6067 [Ophiocordyceps polyrhachis-furcata BCC 54312]
MASSSGPMARASASAGKRTSSSASKRPKRTKRERNMGEGSADQVLRFDVDALLSSVSPEFWEMDPQGDPGLRKAFSEIEVDIVDISANGDGLGLLPSQPNHVYIVPFTVPGDKAKIRIIHPGMSDHHSTADLVAVVKPSPLRSDYRARCRYFGHCGGCQYQMLEYSEQLRLKRLVIVKAYRYFARLPDHLIPPIGETIASPLQYGYRTKLTPHFDGPPSATRRPHKKNRQGEPRPAFEACPDIGFLRKGRRSVMDIEDCPIATAAIRRGLKRERERMRNDFVHYNRGATILLRESTSRYDDDGSVPNPPDPNALRVEGDGFVDLKTCETDSKAITTEYIGKHIFTNPAGAFFQNNNSILPVFTAYVRDNILPPSASSSSSSTPSADSPFYLIDAYCGSGLFTVTLASLFTYSTGIDVAADSIESARSNAALNGLTEDRCRFIAADARDLFREIEYPPDRTAVVLDPPRKGCDGDFLDQLTRFGPRRILYVSCNVNTQARDVGCLVRGKAGGAAYRLRSLVGFDFFPQTAHVEGVAILDRYDGEDESGANGRRNDEANSSDRHGDKDAQESTPKT